MIGSAVDAFAGDESAALGSAPRVRRLRRGILDDRTALFGLGLVGVIAAVATLAPFFLAHDPAAANVARRFQSVSSEHLLGTDHLGRDVWARLVHGARLSIGATVITALAVGALGTVVGLVAGYSGGLVDACISRTIDALLAFPGLLLALALVGLFGPGLRNVILALVAVGWAGYARIVRSAVLVARQTAYVEAARAIGASHWRVVVRHIVPNIGGPIVVLTTLDLGSTMLSLSALSFLGLGVQPPTPEWGAMLSDARSYVGQAPNMMLFPGIAILLVVLGFNLVGDGLRDAMDPRARSPLRG